MKIKKIKVLLLASYCVEEDTNCTEELPCIECLKMCNVAEIEGKITKVLGGFDYLTEQNNNILSMFKRKELK